MPPGSRPNRLARLGTLSGQLMSNSLIPTTGIVSHEIGGVLIGQRKADGYINATALRKAAGKQWGDYWRLGTSQEFVQALAESTGIPVDSLAEMRSGRGGGTWVHPRLATHLAQWISPSSQLRSAGGSTIS
jgi:hypothetical protein